MRSLQFSGKRFKPRELEGNPEIVEQIIDMFVVKGWSAKYVAAQFDDPRVTPRTVYGISRRYRKRQKKLLREAEAVRDRVKPLPAKKVDSRGPDEAPEVIAAETIELSHLDPSLVLQNSDEVDVVALRQKHREFLLAQADYAARLSQMALQAAHTSIDRDEDPQAIDARIRSWERTVNSFRKLSGLENEDLAPKPNSLHLHQHLHQLNNPFG